MFCALITVIARKAALRRVDADHTAVVAQQRLHFHAFDDLRAEAPRGFGESAGDEIWVGEAGIRFIANQRGVVEPRDGNSSVAWRASSSSTVMP
jgi:hypothetical protein